MRTPEQIAEALISEDADDAELVSAIYWWRERGEQDPTEARAALVKVVRSVQDEARQTLLDEVNTRTIEAVNDLLVSGPPVDRLPAVETCLGCDKPIKAIPGAEPGQPGPKGSARFSFAICEDCRRDLGNRIERVIDKLYGAVIVAALPIPVDQRDVIQWGPSIAERLAPIQFRGCEKHNVKGCPDCMRVAAGISEGPKPRATGPLTQPPNLA